MTQMVCGTRQGDRICGRDVERRFVGITELWGHSTRLPDGQHHYVNPVPAPQPAARFVPGAGTRMLGGGGRLRRRSAATTG